LKHLSALNKYLVKYKWRLLGGTVFIVLSNIFAVLSPQIVKDTLDAVYVNIGKYHQLKNTPAAAILRSEVMHQVMLAGIYLLAYALLRGIFMFFMRQTIIVMSRHIEYDQKNEIYDQYQKLSTSFYKSNATGDLMSRISEDVSRVRMYIGPAIMYILNLVALIALCLWKMIGQSPMLTLYVVAPLPFLALSIYYVNKIVNRKGEKIQAELSGLTSQAQEAYSGIRVIKSFVREENSIKLFSNVSQSYKKSNINLSLTESIYFPSMNLFIGLSMLLTVFIGGWYTIEGYITVGNIIQFVMYITMLMFPISAIGWTANMIQRASVSQRRINEFLDAKPEIENSPQAIAKELKGKVEFRNVTFIYPHTGIVALKNFSLVIQPGEQIAVIGKTGSGKSTLVHLLLRMYDVTEGEILIDDLPIKKWDLTSLRHQMSYVPQDVFLFSDSIANNISMGQPDRNDALIREAAKMAHIDKEVRELPQGYETITGERGVMLSGGQKQRISLARAIIKKPELLILDESLSAVDATTEQAIQQNLGKIHHKKTAIVITHRIFKSWNFDKIIVLEDGQILEAGNHDELMHKNGQYAKLFNYQTLSED